MWELIGDAFKHSNAHSANIPASESLMDYMKKHVESSIRKRDVAEEKVEERKDVILKAAEMWGSFIGGTTNGQSLKFLWLEECLDGENLFCAGTYAKVLDLVSKAALEKADVRFGCVVEKIASKEVDGAPEVEVRTRGGVKEVFDEVVVTCPLGWLKRNRDVFEPKLPERMGKAIEELGYGNLDKVKFALWLKKMLSNIWNRSTSPFPRPSGIHRSPSPRPTATALRKRKMKSRI